VSATKRQPKDHGTNPEQRLHRIHVLVAETEDVYYGYTRTYILKRHPDGGWAPRIRGSQGLTEVWATILKPMASSRAHAEALMAATALVRTRPFDERYAHLRSQQARNLLASMPEPGDEWPPATLRTLDLLFDMAKSALPGAELLVGGEPDSVRKTMQAKMAHRITAGDARRDKRLDRRVMEIAKSRAHNPGWGRDCRCGKSRFATKELAELAVLDFATRRGKRPKRAYQCPDSGWYHLTSKLLHW